MVEGRKKRTSTKTKKSGGRRRWVSNEFTKSCFVGQSSTTTSKTPSTARLFIRLYLEWVPRTKYYKDFVNDSSIKEGLSIDLYERIIIYIELLVILVVKI